MARPLRVERPGLWYHVTGRGLERRRIFIDDRDRQHWLELLAEAAERWRLNIYAYVLMENHHHAMLETREANLGRAMHWLNTSYTTWFNRRQGRIGPLFQGRYKAIVVDRLGWGLELSRYLHLNPARVSQLGLDKGARKAQRQGVGGRPNVQQVRERIERLRSVRWSSYRAYVGLAKPPAWLETENILTLVGGGAKMEQQRRYQSYVEEAVREGLPVSPWEQLQGQLVLGSKQLLAKLRLRGDAREQPQLRHMQPRPTWAQIVQVVEKLKEEKWEDFRDRHGDWGRDLAFYLGQRQGGLRLKFLGQAAGGLDYAAVSAAVKRLKANRALDRLVCKAETRLLKIET